MTRWWRLPRCAAWKERLHELERLLGRKTMEVEILNEALEPL
jgi:hypothetical protein